MRETSIYLDELTNFVEIPSEFKWRRVELSEGHPLCVQPEGFLLDLTWGIINALTAGKKVSSINLRFLLGTIQKYTEVDYLGSIELQEHEFWKDNINLITELTDTEILEHAPVHTKAFLFCYGLKTLEYPITFFTGMVENILKKHEVFSRLKIAFIPRADAKFDNMLTFSADHLEGPSILIPRIGNINYQKKYPGRIFY